MSHDEEPEPTEDEIRAAAELARALDRTRDPEPGSDAAFAAAIRATRRQEPALVPSERERMVARAMARGASAGRARTRTRWLAAAAVVLLAAGIPAGWALTHGSTHTSAPAVSFGGPTDAIFSAPFPDDQRASERMDRIASTRAHDYFAAIAAGAR
jgi:hypothetical protein